jgi:hypothetical protein
MRGILAEEVEEQGMKRGYGHCMDVVTGICRKSKKEKAHNLCFHLIILGWPM